MTDDELRYLRLQSLLSGVIAHSRTFTPQKIALAFLDVPGLLDWIDYGGLTRVQRDAVHAQLALVLLVQAEILLGARSAELAA